MNLPNKLTLARVIAVPFFIVIYLLGHIYTATIIFILASATDALDGHIARSRGLVTNFGKIMDPLADKILVISALVILVQLGDVAGWMLIVILAREFIVAGLRTVAAADGIVIAAGFSGKLKTCFSDDCSSIASSENWPCKYINIPLDQIMLWICVILTSNQRNRNISLRIKEVFLKGGL